MASLDFELEKGLFRDYYDMHTATLQNACNSFSSLLTDLLSQLGGIPISKIETRVKDREECIKKFNRKYRQALEEANTHYSIKDSISDLVGLRIVCLYEDDIEKIGNLLTEQFEILTVTNKIEAIEKTEGSFGYKGLHYDIKLKNPRLALPEYGRYADLAFEVQVRTIIQDSWSVLDHKIKYKKSIPGQLKRRINTLAALFELADREFRQIRDSTEDEIQKVESEPADAAEFVQSADAGTAAASEGPTVRGSAKLDAFNFLKIASHFFPTYDFEPQKVDGFVQEVAQTQQSITRSDFNTYMKENFTKIKSYQHDLQSTNDTRMNPFTIIRHCLYLGDKDVFKSILTNVAKKNFEDWLNKSSTS